MFYYLKIFFYPNNCFSINLNIENSTNNKKIKFLFLIFIYYRNFYLYEYILI